LQRTTVFADALSITISDPDHSEGEARFLDLGLSPLRGNGRKSHFSDPRIPSSEATFNMSGTKPVYQDGKWSFEDQSDMYLDGESVEPFKTNFYKLEGWDVKTGWPTRKTLEGLGMNKVADVMAAKGRLGA